MIHLENQFFSSEPQLKPTLYCRNANNGFMLIKSSDDISKQIDRFQHNHILTFTSDIGTKNSINFLDFHVAEYINKYETSVFNIKATIVVRALGRVCLH